MLKSSSSPSLVATVVSVHIQSRCRKARRVSWVPSVAVDVLQQQRLLQGFEGSQEMRWRTS
ncbi:hypothetical protein E2C01_032751 [Portunus trituberculatus]|uniref:Uncharacterized protein n=1 Tax=Portunus trituberculatus TaxID=210409 RepID=A0A5B7F292_PORTR|nr:hypothetical protein [Portunus trituberculatus]